MNANALLAHTVAAANTIARVALMALSALVAAHALGVVPTRYRLNLSDRDLGLLFAFVLLWSATR